MAELGITFDFHNTIAACDEWFQLEVRHLVSSFMRWHDKQNGVGSVDELLDKADMTYRSLRQAILVHGNEQTAEQCVTTVLADMGVSVPSDVISQGVHELMWKTAPLAYPLAGVLKTVAELGAEGVPLGIVSSAVYHPFLEWTLQRFNIRDAFTVVVTSASCGFYKSRPEIFLHAAHALGVDARHVVHIGDSLRFDVGGAQRAGMRAILVGERPASRGNGDPVPHFVLPSLENAAPSIIDLLYARR